MNCHQLCSINEYARAHTRILVSSVCIVRRLQIHPPCDARSQGGCCAFECFVVVKRIYISINIHIFLQNFLAFVKFSLSLPPVWGRNPESKMHWLLFRTYRKDLGNLIRNSSILEARERPEKGPILVVYGYAHAYGVEHS